MNTYDLTISICPDGRFFVSASENTPKDLVDAVKAGLKETINQYFQQNNRTKCSYAMRRMEDARKGRARLYD